MNYQSAMRAKSREFQSALMDSTVWNDFAFRKGDVIIATWAKCGTTWMQQIATQIIFNASEDVAMNKISPWYDARITPPEVRAAVAKQEHRRILKTHQAAFALTLFPEVRFIFVARDGRDAVWSLHHHYVNLVPAVFDAFNSAPNRVGPPLTRPEGSALDFFREWLAKDGHPHPSFWETMRSWWEARHEPNVKLVHYNNLKADLAGEMTSIAAFLGVAMEPDVFAKAVEHCGFDYMRENADRMAPRGGVGWVGGARTFIHKGTNGRWRDELPEAESVAYEELARHELGDECARWLAHGSTGH